METSDSTTYAHIPLCEPNLGGNEKKYTLEAIDSNWLSGGHFLNLFEKQLVDFTGAGYAVGVSSGTSALHIALLLAGVQANDMVLVPNLTFVATANSVKYLKADPILIDIDPNSWVIDLELLRDFLSKYTYFSNDESYYLLNHRRIKAILPVHLLGNMCDMEELVLLCNEYNITVVEDAACSLGSYQNKKHSGTFGLLGTLSFNSNKIITTGGGGAILTDNEDIAKKARYLISQAKSPGIEYLHSDLGYNYRLVNPLAAIGAAQMEQLEKFIGTKKWIAAFYKENLSLNETNIQKLTSSTNSNFWHFVMLTERSRELISFLSNQKIETRPAWLPINQMPIFKQDAYINTHDYAKQVSDKGIMLPCSTSITEEQLARVCTNINRFLE